MEYSSIGCTATKRKLLTEEWAAEYSDEFGLWWDSLNESEQDDVAAVVEVLQRVGPSLRRPLSGSIEGSRYPNMKELVIQHTGTPYRVLYAFDPRRIAILLVGGNKTGINRWYEEFVPQADRIYGDHLEALGKEGLL